MKVGDLVQVTWKNAVEGRIGLVTCETVGFVSVLAADFITIKQTRTVGCEECRTDTLTTIPRAVIETSRSLETGRKRSLKATPTGPKDKDKE